MGTSWIQSLFGKCQFVIDAEYELFIVDKWGIETDLLFCLSFRNTISKEDIEISV